LAPVSAATVWEVELRQPVEQDWANMVQKRTVLQWVKLDSLGDTAMITKRHLIVRIHHK
jgi:hypothetical protein